MEINAPIIISILYIIIAIVVITINGILAAKKQNPYAKIIPPCIIIVLVSMWILYMGAWLAQWHPLINPTPN